MSNLSFSRDHILERFDRILGYLSSFDRVSDHYRDSNHDRASDHYRDSSHDRVRSSDRDRDSYQQRYRKKD